MKTLKFVEPLPSLILSGEKDVTWRINDDENLKLEDKISLIKMENKTEFSQAKIIFVKETIVKLVNN